MFNCCVKYAVPTLKIPKIAFIAFLLMSAQIINLPIMPPTKRHVRDVICDYTACICVKAEEGRYIISIKDESIRCFTVVMCDMIKVAEINEEKIVKETYSLELKSEPEWYRSRWVNLVPNNFCTYGDGKGSRRFKRSRLEIYAQILRCLQFNLLSLSEIAFYAGLNYKAARRHVNLLVANNLVNAIKRNGKIYYMISPSRRTFIRHFEEIKRLLKAEGGINKRRD